MQTAATVVAVCLTALAFVATVWRLFYGVDFIDEALYAALAYRFAMGARPFIDIVDPHQTSALLVAPYVKLHLLVFGNTTGIMLSLRFLWAALNATAAAAWFIMLRKMMDWRLAMLASAASFALIPYMIPAPSFNTMPLMLGSIGVALIGISVPDHKRPWGLVGAGVLLGLATFCYPTLIVSSVLMIAGVWWLTRSWRQPLYFAAGGLATAAILTLLLLPYLSGLPRVIEFASALGSRLSWVGTGGGGPLTKVRLIAYYVRVVMVEAPALYLAVAVGVLQVMRRKVPWWLSALLVASLAVAPLSVLGVADLRTLILAISVLIAALIVAFTVRRPRDGDVPPRVRFVRLALLYGAVSGMVFAFTSSQGWVFLGIGAAAVFAPSVAVLGLRMATSLADGSLPRIAPVLQVVATGLVIVGLVFYNATGFYRDDSPFKLTTRVRTGPQAGLITTPLNASNSESLWAEMQRVSTASDRVLSYQGFPAGYLFTAATPVLPNLWLQPWDAMGIPSITASDLKLLSDPATKPTVVIRNFGWPNMGVLLVQNPSRYDPKLDAVEAFVEANYATEGEDRLWDVLTPDK